MTLSKAQRNGSGSGSGSGSDSDSGSDSGAKGTFQSFVGTPSPVLSACSSSDMSPSPSLGRAYNTTLAVGKKSFGWRTFAVGLWYDVPLLELFWSVMYTMTVLIIGWIYIDPADPTATQAVNIGNLCGLLAFIQFPLVVGLASKNNVLSWFTGISYERLNFLHRASGRALLILSWTHVVSRGMIIGLSGKTSLKLVKMRMGVVAFLAYNLLFLLSLKPFLRSMAYEVFLISHMVLALLLLVGCYMHWTEFGSYIWPAILIWGLDRFVRVANIIFLNKLWLSFRPSSANVASTAVVKILPDAALEVTMERSMRWVPGQHVYLTCPQISRFPFEAHPFTVASIQSNDSSGPSTVRLIIRVRDGFTGRLANATQKAGGQTEVKAWLDGPHGLVKGLTSYHSVVLISGGSGVTYTLPQLLSLVEQAKQESVSWIGSTLASIQASCPASLILEIKIFITQTNSVHPSGTGSPVSSSQTLPAIHPHAIPVGLSEQSNEKPLKLDSAESSESGSSDGHENEKRSTEYSIEDSIGRCVSMGRPDLDIILRDVVDGARSGAVNVSVCGPTSLSNAVRESLASGNAYRLADVAKGKVGAVDLHVESFGW
ncbi:Ferric reductase, NADH/NADPH oxidase and related proteins [Phaffia rhodozyma]|uniref:ferric-chelate reductase (NADPH) n=1 Tax=Phaffia rhodozyma TaxID=264483 RepID=A0A0F7SLT1_PHARH|nr:Ferric reductase, NADH/NADPH oxidase and related proteins [Phaffia rhodozyma]